MGEGRPPASDLELERTPLPFTLRIVLAFVLLHAARSALLAGIAAWRTGTGDLTALSDAILPHVLYFCSDLLVATQIAIRARTGLFWGTAYFGALAFFTAAVFVIDPARWPLLGLVERLRVIASVGVNVGLIALLLARPSRAALVR